MYPYFCYLKGGPFPTKEADGDAKHVFILVWPNGIYSLNYNKLQVLNSGRFFIHNSNAKSICVLLKSTLKSH